MSFVLTERCEGITSAGKQCKCYATQKVNGIPYCDQHTNKELKSISEALARKFNGEEGR